MRLPLFILSEDVSARKVVLFRPRQWRIQRGRNPGGGGGGGTQIWFRRGCAVEAAKLVPIFKGHFGGKGYPLLGGFIQENYVFVYFSDEIRGLAGKGTHY